MSVVVNRYAYFFFIFVALSQGKVLTNSHVVLIEQKSQNQSIRILVAINRFPWCTKSIILNQITGLIDRGCDITIYSAKRVLLKKVDPAVYQYDLLSKTYYEQLPPDLQTYDIILCQYGSLGKKFVNIKKRYGLKAKLVTCLRGSDITNQKEIRNDAYLELFEYGDLFLPVCDYYRNKMIELGCDPEKIIVHPSAIDCLKFFFKERSVKQNQSVHIVTVCRLQRKKGTKYAIRAIAQLIDKGYKICFSIIGDGPCRKELERLIRKLHVEQYVELKGWKNQDEIVEILNTAHIFVLPSVTTPTGTQEGIPNALKEAMAMGIPVVSTYHAGIPELVENGVSGFLVPERDVSILRKKLEYLITHQQEWKRMGKAGRKKVLQEFEIEKTNDRLIKIFEMLLKL